MSPGVLHDNALAEVVNASGAQAVAPELERLCGCVGVGVGVCVWLACRSHVVAHTFLPHGPLACAQHPPEGALAAQSSGIFPAPAQIDQKRHMNTPRG